MMIRFFKWIAISEGFSYLALLANMFITKPLNLDLYKIILFPLGLTHGFLFIAYVILAFIVKPRLNWDLKSFLEVLLASLLPFGTFFIEKKYLRR